MQEIVPNVESLPLSVVMAAAVCVIVAAAIVLRVAGNNLTGKRPPVIEGIPYLGGILGFMKPMELMSRGYDKCGEVFTVPVGWKRITFLLGPQVVQPFFKANDEQMGQEEVYGYCVPAFGPRVVYDVHYKVRNEQLKLFAEALRAQKIKGYVPQIVQEAEDYIRNNLSKGEGELDPTKMYSGMILQTASRTLLGREVRETLFEQVADLFHELDQGMLPISVLAPYLPIPAHRRRDRARKEMAAIFSKIVRARRESGVKENDIPQAFIDGRYQKTNQGRQLDEEEVTGMLIAGLFAGQHTSNITASWTTIYLASRKDLMERAMAEQRAVIDEFGEELSYEAIDKMSFLHTVIQEVLRLHPPLIILLRYAKTAFTVETSSGKVYEVPKGHVVAVAPMFHHRLPVVFKDPLQFDPDRFAAPREEDKTLPYGYIAFGAGRHACMGGAFALVQIKTAVSLVLRSFHLELVSKFPQPDFSSLVIGPEPCRIRYTPRSILT